MPVIIEDLTHATSGLLVDPHPELFDNPVDPEQLERFVVDPLHLMKLAVSDGRVVGFASGTILLHPDKPPQLFVNELSVVPERRRQGIGRRLVEALIVAAGDKGCTYAWLATEAENAAANACYRGVRDLMRSEEAVVVYECDLAR